VVALLAGSAGALITDAIHTSPHALTTTVTLTPPISSGFSGAQIVAAVEPAVVTIEAQTSEQTVFGGVAATSAGTGIIVTATGLVATNGHVISGATTITVTLTCQPTPRAASLVGEDTAADLALIRISGASGLPTVKLASSSGVHVGDDVLAIGNALDLTGGLTVTRGIVSALNRSVQTQTQTMTGLIQTDAAISSGNSGGPLVNASGQVIGIDTLAMTSSRGTTAENIGFAIPIDQALPVLRRLGLTESGA